MPAEIGVDIKVDWKYRSCPVCCDKNNRLLFHDHNRREGYAVETDLVECSTCGMHYLNPIPEREDWLKEYSKLYSVSNDSQRRPSWLARVSNSLLSRWVQIWSRDLSLHELPSGSGIGCKLLDIGCGSGTKLVTYEQRGFEIYGIDLVRESIADASRTVRGTFYSGAIETARLPHTFFDFIRFDNVLEHIYQPRNFLSKVYRLLKPGGIAYGYVPNGLSPTIQIMGKYSISSWVPFHINLFTSKCLRMLATEVGFETDVRGISYAHWVMQSVRQWRFRNQLRFDEQKFDWIDKSVLVGAAPLWWLFNKVWQGEELMLIARRPQKELV